MKKIKINASVSYDVIIDSDILKNAGELAKAVVSPSTACIVTDSNVNSLYADTVERSFTESGFNVIKFVFKAGEASKSTHTLVSLLEFLAENRVTASDLIVALGGGVVGDLSGFASSVYLRGMRFIQIPTTLLSAVDSSVGGKTAVNLEAGKNLAGAFHQPSLVICDIKTLDTLSPEIFADGCAEVIKYGVINDKPLFELTKRGIRENLEEIIARCVKNKADIVCEDEFDKGKRQLLNLGHTGAHAIEHLSNFSISHGSAVAIGMVLVMRSAVSSGICDKSELDELISVLKSASLPTECSYSAKDIAEIALADKKRRGDSINLVIPYSIGNSRLVKTDVDELESFFERGL